jgi:energy-coupling factor transport system permease protein
MFFTHPVCLAISLLCSFAYSVSLNGRKALLFILLYMLPMFAFTLLVGPLFNHHGGTILTYLPNGNPLTLESILFGVAAATMLITVITWFSCFNTVMTSDKFVYLFGRITPALSLILSMSLRLVPRFRAQIRIISNAQRCVGRDVPGSSLFQKLKHRIRILSIIVTWALENAIETADSMKGRGYGLPGRTSFSIFRFTLRDICAFLYLSGCSAIVFAGVMTGVYRFRYFPTIRSESADAAAIVVFIAYLGLCLFPIILNIKEYFTWKYIESKI